jgi:CBS domain-containing protein
MGTSRASEIMVRRVFTVGPDLTVLDLEQQLHAQHVSGAPVVEHGRVVGIVSRSDIDRLVSHERSRAAATGRYTWQADLPEGEEGEPRSPAASAMESLQKTLVREIMTPEVISVSPDAPLAHVARVMCERRIHRVLVIERGRLCGIIGSLDLVRVLAEAEG